MTVDTQMMGTVHDAFLRDLERLGSMSKNHPEPDAALQELWQRFKTFLHIHHTAEDTHLWPIIRTRSADAPAELALLDQMESEHVRLSTLLSDLDTAMTSSASRSHLHVQISALFDALSEHCEHEETLALPIVERRLTEPEWNAFGREQRRQLGRGGGAIFLPWLLDAASRDVTQSVLSRLPVPARVLYRLVWRPRYQRANVHATGYAAISQT